MSTSISHFEFEFGPKCSEGKHTLRVWWTRHLGRRGIICSFICFIPLDVCSSAVAAVKLAAGQRVDWAQPQVAPGCSELPVWLSSSPNNRADADYTVGVAHGESHTVNTRPSDGLTDIWSLKHRWVAHRDPSQRGKPVEAGQVDHINMEAQAHLNHFNSQYSTVQVQP